VCLKRDDTRAETRLLLSSKRTSPFKSARASVQSTAGSRGVGISVSNAGYTTFRGRMRVLATHSIRQFPLHFPSRALPCDIRFRTHSIMLTRTGILTVHFTTLLHISFCFKRTNSDVYSGDALFESAPRFCLSRRGVIMISIGLNTICLGGASNRPRSISKRSIYCSSVILPFDSIYCNTAKAS